MQKKKEIFLGKVLKRNFNNELEYLLEHKNFEETVKNLLLSMFYKLETAYNDYELVKSGVIHKEEFLSKYLEIIEKNVDIIELLDLRTTNSKIIIDKESKKIMCYPIEIKLLHALSQIRKEKTILKDKYLILNQSISNLLNIGDNINSIEPLRDFNGFSWLINAKEIEGIEYNLLYQNLRIIIEEKFLNNWIINKDKIIDYYDLFKNKLEEKYGESLKNKIVDLLEILSILIQIKYNKDQINDILEAKEKIEKQINNINNIEEFTIKLTKDKKELNKRIKEIDTIISDKELLKEEYLKRNSELPLDKKIFSIRVLAKNMKDERQKLVEKKSAINDMLNPQKFIKYKKSLIEEYKYLKLVDIKKNEIYLKQYMVLFQNIVLNVFNIKIEQAINKEELYNIVREFRYYLNIPVNKKMKTRDIKELSEKIELIKNLLIEKALELKLFSKISTNKEINFKIYRELFNTRIIDLNEVNIKITQEDEKYYLQLFDENVFEEKLELSNNLEINNKNFSIKLNKIIKGFNF